MYCSKCFQNHSQILQRDALAIAKALLDGDGQIVTRYGIENMCLLDILGWVNHRKVSRSELTANRS